MPEEVAKWDRCYVCGRVVNTRSQKVDQIPVGFGEEEKLVFVCSRCVGRESPCVGGYCDGCDYCLPYGFWNPNQF